MLGGPLGVAATGPASAASVPTRRHGSSVFPGAARVVSARAVAYRLGIFVREFAVPPACDGKLALVTGGGRGIGRAVCEALAGAGARVLAVSRTLVELEETRAAIVEAGGLCEIQRCDMSDEAQILALYETADALGPVDILINNAGFGVFAACAETATRDWDAVQAANARGAFIATREAMRRMRGRGGRIVNIASVVGLKGYARQVAYTASKHALMGLTRVAAVEGQGDDIIVQAVCPGGVDTGMIGDARPDLDRSGLMAPAEVAEAVLFLLGQTGNAITDMISLRRRGSAPFAI